jgi:hypothetical protein
MTAASTPQRVASVRLDVIDLAGVPVCDAELVEVHVTVEPVAAEGPVVDVGSSVVAYRVVVVVRWLRRHQVAARWTLGAATMTALGTAGYLLGAAGVGVAFLKAAALVLVILAVLAWLIAEDKCPGVRHCLKCPDR